LAEKPGTGIDPHNKMTKGAFLGERRDERRRKDRTRSVNWLKFSEIDFFVNIIEE
jgi:hypothetical protein